MRRTAVPSGKGGTLPMVDDARTGDAPRYTRPIPARTGPIRSLIGQAGGNETTMPPIGHTRPAAGEQTVAGPPAAATDPAGTRPPSGHPGMRRGLSGLIEAQA